MTLGIVMLVHAPLDRAAQVARFWADAGCPIVIHVDRRVSQAAFRDFADELSDYPDIRFSRRFRCEWGTWSLVEASQTASAQLLDQFPGVRHVYLASGACLPLRPVEELRAFLDDHPASDFIESVAMHEVPWTIGGFDDERFTLSFPFPWKRRRWLFDTWVRIQRRLKLHRRIPQGLTPHLGSQWWCLTRQTLSAILEDPNRPRLERFFRRVWIPDESYYQTLARLYARRIESRSLTLSKFDHQGKPHVFYDDHLDLLRRSDCFVARKIWPGADRLYRTFLRPGPQPENDATPNPARLDRVFARALDRRTRGRAGLYMQSRYPNWDWENGRTAAPYSVICGHGDLFEGFPDWLTDTADCLAHGHLFASDRVEFAGGQSVFAGCLPDAPALRNHNPNHFLANLIWNTRGEQQAFLFGPRDDQHVTWFMAADPNARISVVTGAWAVPLFHANRNFSEIRAEAAEVQRNEAEFVKFLRGPHTKARVRIWSMAEFLEDPIENLSLLIDDIGPRAGTGAVIEAPHLRPLEGFGAFLQTLRNQGMNPHMVGDFPAEYEHRTVRTDRPRPYVVK